MQVTSAVSDALEKYLDLTSAQMKLTTANMANVDTPGYKTQGLDFEKEFVQQLNEVGRGEAQPELEGQPVNGLVARPDGNDVSMDREGMMLAKTQLQFRLGVELLKQDFANVMSAIHAEAR